MSLEKDLETYRRNLPEWTEYDGKYVLIKDESVHGFYSSYDDALTEGYKQFKLEPFLVKRVNMIEKPPLISRLFAPCHTSRVQ